MAMASAICWLSSSAQIGVPLGDFRRRLVRQPIEQVVGLDAQALAPGHLDERPVRVVGRVVAQLAGGRVRQRHHLVRVVDRVRRLLRRSRAPPAPA